MHDTDNDGTITLDEYRKVRAALMNSKQGFRSLRKYVQGSSVFHAVVFECFHVGGFQSFDLKCHKTSFSCHLDTSQPQVKSSCKLKPVVVMSTCTVWVHNTCVNLGLLK